MLQVHSPSNGSLTASSSSPIQEDVEHTLLFEPATGSFTFDSQSPDSLDVFRIRCAAPLTVPQRIIIHTAENVRFIPNKPIESLKVNNSGNFNVVSFNSTQIEIDVTELPSASGILGFVLMVAFIGDSTHTHIERIQTPPFLITRNEPFPEPALHLDYNPQTGVFKITPASGSITLQEGLVIFRLHDGSPSPSPNIHVFLSEGSASAGIVFADTPILPQHLGVRDSDIKATVTRNFISGTGFNVSFGVSVPVGEGDGQTCTVYSPDPIIFDKQIGGPGSAV